MFKNIGKKIKILAKVLCWIGIVMGAIAGVTMFILAGVESSRRNGYYYYSSSNVGLYVGLGFTFLIVYPLLSWISTWLLYSWGETVENVQKIKESICTGEEQAPAVKEKKKATTHLDTLLEKGLITQEEYNRAVNK